MFLLVAQSAIAGTSAWCPEDAHGEETATSVAMAYGMSHADARQAAPEAEEQSHHGSDAQGACPMMALCTLSSPAPLAGLGSLPPVVLDSPDPESWSVHGVLLSHTPPPPRV